MTIVTIKCVIAIVQTCAQGRAGEWIELMAFGLPFWGGWVVVNAMLLWFMIRPIIEISIHQTISFVIICVLLYFIIDWIPQLYSSISEYKFHQSYSGPSRDLIAMHMNDELNIQHALAWKMIPALIGVLALMAYMALSDSRWTNLSDKSPTEILAQVGIDLAKPPSNPPRLRSAAPQAQVLIGFTVLNVIGFVFYGAVCVAATRPSAPPAHGMVLPVVIALLGSSFFAPICAWTIRPFYPTAALVTAIVPAIPVALFLAAVALVTVTVAVRLALLSHARAHSAFPPSRPAFYRPATMPGEPVR